MLQVAMISTGEEVLHGDITDTNAAWLSRQFFEQGFALSRRITVGDQLDTLAEELLNASLRHDVVIVNGGLGPTTDDLTAQAAAVAADVGLEQSDHWVEQMVLKYQKLGREMPHTNLKQAMLPEGAELLDNPVGTACGFAMKLNRATLYFTPGVPTEFKLMVTDEILPRLQRAHPQTQARDCHRLFTFGLSESGIGEQLSSLALPDECELGYRSSLPFIEVKLFAPQQCADAKVFYQQMAAMLGEYVVSQGQPMLASVGEQLQQQALTISISEHFTGGYLASWLQSESALRQQFAHSVVGEVKASSQSAESKGVARADIHIEIGELVAGQVSVELTTPQAVFSQKVSTKRDYGYQAHRTMIATLALDMLRRWLTSRPVYSQYSSLDTERYESGSY
ncbi:competence/damage-inducible protein A [Photobacterium jeanii]|uniref:CinA-like protein n=1 Tax=Photobacterium jeanii TaxID=858640 RepID=A0A178KNI3_9GAMM|nr:CinA family nicotinamide mononucleotide deamidase-related protein [Photobacterium jeanii]OAN18314.1 competence/damage-inducible protein A [Photobacterium jeanii]PST92006.1 competence/damage-inducible protein A [Photobacterium jeanii]